ncbi:hypothetical protein HMPREF0027_2104, partial [Actinobacillus ureae ATCC 25976]
GADHKRLIQSLVYNKFTINMIYSPYWKAGKKKKKTNKINTLLNLKLTR